MGKTRRKQKSFDDEVSYDLGVEDLVGFANKAHNNSKRKKSRESYEDEYLDYLEEIEAEEEKEKV
jgi:uncharacterized protein VirK/YbjX